MSVADDAFVEAIEALGMHARSVDNDGDADLLADVHGRLIAIQLKYRALVSHVEFSELPAATSGWQEDVPRLQVMVADRLLASGREALDRLGWSWLDLRGHLHLVGPGVHIDTPVPAYRPRPDRARALSGSAGLEVACALLLAAEPGHSVRRLARDLGRAPSTVSEVLKALRSEGLVEKNGQIAVPELFWEVASVWRPTSAAAITVSEPKPGAGAQERALRFGLKDVESTPGWALTDTLAAAAYGAPVVAASDHPLDFYVPDTGILRRAQMLLDSSMVTERKATIRVAPVSVVCSRRVDLSHRANQVWPVASPLFVALDLVQDVGRGREIVAQWDPDGWRRVW